MVMTERVQTKSTAVCFVPTYDWQFVRHQSRDIILGWQVSNVAAPHSDVVRFSNWRLCNFSCLRLTSVVGKPESSNIIHLLRKIPSREREVMTAFGLEQMRNVSHIPFIEANQTFAYISAHTSSICSPQTYRQGHFSRELKEEFFYDRNRSNPIQFPTNLSSKAKGENLVQGCSVCRVRTSPSLAIPANSVSMSSCCSSRSILRLS